MPEQATEEKKRADRQKPEPTDPTQGSTVEELPTADPTAGSEQGGAERDPTRAAD
jgi:hypothetical protein